LGTLYFISVGRSRFLLKQLPSADESCESEPKNSHPLIYIIYTIINSSFNIEMFLISVNEEVKPLALLHDGEY